MITKTIFLALMSQRDQDVNGKKAILKCVLLVDIFYESEDNCNCRVECRRNDYELSISYSILSADYVGEMAAAIGFKNNSWNE